MVNPVSLVELGLANLTMMPFAYYYAKMKLTKTQYLEEPEEIPNSKILVLLPIWNGEDPQVLITVARATC